MKANPDNAFCVAGFLEDPEKSNFTDSLLETIHRNAAKKKKAISGLFGDVGFKLKSIDASDLYRLRKYYTDCMTESGWQLMPQLSGSEEHGFWSVAYRNERKIIIICSMSANNVENEKIPVIILSNLLN